jgi:hypothetical protein
MIRIFVLAALLLAAPCARAQELFVFTEPASNMPAHSVGLRVSNWLMEEVATSRLNYHLIPELMWGVNKNLMLHAEGFFSNRNRGLSAEGGAVYAKYRFFSKDGLYRHFRSAAFVRLAANNADIHQEEIETNGHNSGVELGLIATQLLHKLALNGTASWEHATDNSGGHEFPAQQSSKALNFSFSAGRLLLPKHYNGYGQTNLNVMLEVLSQYHPENGKVYVDMAPSVQLIFNSQTRVDIAYKRQLTGNMQRTAPNGLMVRVEHLLFNVL